MWKTLRQIHRAGIVTELPPSTDEALRVSARRCRSGFARCWVAPCAFAHVDAGSCNGCELEIHALGNPFYNLEGLGIRFVASPRHADLLLVTGPVSQKHGGRTATDLRRDAGSKAGRRGRRLRLHRRNLWRELREPRSRLERYTGGRGRAGLPA